MVSGYRDSLSTAARDTSASPIDWRKRCLESTNSSIAYYGLSRPSNFRTLRGGTESPNPHEKITSLIKVKYYGVAGC
jgi:hypothetical protein